MIMQSKMQVFENNEFGSLGILTLNGKIYFPATDCAKALGYANTIDAISRHCKGVVKHDPLTNGGKQRKNYIPEGDLYRLIIRSKLPAAERFEAWVFDEVLPSIRKHGAYITEDVIRHMQENSDYANELLRSLTTERTKNNTLIGKMAALTPKAHYHDTVLQCPNAVQVTIIAKDYGMSAVSFNRLLHKLKVQFRIGKTWLLYNEHQGNGYTITNTYTKNGVNTMIHTCFTQRGRFWLYELLKSHGILPEAEKTAYGEQMSLEDVGA